MTTVSSNISTDIDESIKTYPHSRENTILDQEINDISAHSENQREQVYSTDKLVKRPSTISETGLSDQLLIQLLIKHLHVLHVSTVRTLSDELGLCGGIIQILIDTAKSSGWVENRQSLPNGQMRYALSGIGVKEAELAFASSGYIGVAPVPLSQYADVVVKQTSRNTQITKPRMDARFQGLMFSESLTSAIGPALNSTKPILIYGVPGVGKSFLCRNLNKLFGDEVYIPAAIEVHGNIIKVYDAQVHIQTSSPTKAADSEVSLTLDQGHDPRWHLCERPLIVTGGELTGSMLEVHYDECGRTYKAPLQLKANNGLLLIDDLGRQKITPIEIFNRWIIPLEERRDFLSLPNGVHFEIPFELILLFSTNMDPASLVDEAFLRRLGYKIEFKPLELDNYKTLWFDVCQANGLACSSEVFDHLINKHHNPTQKPFLPCIPRDLLSIISDQIKFKQLAYQVDEVLIDTAWNHYFVS